MSPSTVAIQRNPNSGTRSRRSELLDLIATLKSRGLRPRLFSNRQKLAEWMGRDENRRSLKTLVAAGGDGTVGDLINRYPDLPLAILPLGTENLLAQHLGIPRDGRRVADIIARGRSRRMDLMVANGRRCCIVGSIGIDAAIVAAVHAARRGQVSRWSYFREFLRVMKSRWFPKLTITVEGRAEPIEGRQIFVVNAPRYAMQFPIAAAARDDDGLLDVRILTHDSRRQALKNLVRLAFGLHEKHREVVSLTTTRVDIDSETPTPVQIDGDPAGTTPISFSILPNALEIIIP